MSEWHSNSQGQESYGNNIKSLLTDVDEHLGTKFAEKFDNDKMITGEELSKLATYLGMVTEQPRNFGADELRGFLGNGPIWALVSWPGGDGITHSLIIDHIDGPSPDATGENTTLHYYDLWEKCRFHN